MHDGASQQLLMFLVACGLKCFTLCSKLSTTQLPSRRKWTGAFARAHTLCGGRTQSTRRRSACPTLPLKKYAVHCLRAGKPLITCETGFRVIHVDMGRYMSIQYALWHALDITAYTRPRGKLGLRRLR